jgi:hypothetical protein
MAYMIGDKGPYPNKAGEFCGNYRNDLRMPPTVRIGRPKPGRVATTAEMESQGHVGWYLLADLGDGAGLECNHGKEITEVPTPPELAEPAAEGR